MKWIIAYNFLLGKVAGAEGVVAQLNEMMRQARTDKANDYADKLQDLIYLIKYKTIEEYRKNMKKYKVENGIK